MRIADVVVRRQRADRIWEWRTFDELRLRDLERLREATHFKSQRVVDEYFLYLHRDDLNLKFRDSSLKIKRLLRTVGGLPEWAHLVVPIPVWSPVLLPWLDGEEPEMGEAGQLLGRPGIEDLLQHVPGGPTVTIALDKVRHIGRVAAPGFRIRLELAAVRFGNTHLRTVAIDARSRDELVRAVKCLGLADYSNSDYLFRLRPDAVTRARRENQTT